MGRATDFKGIAEPAEADFNENYTLVCDQAE